MPVRGDAVVLVDACVAVVAVRSRATNRSGDRLLGAVVDVHNGRIAGDVGEAIVFIAGLGLGVLPLLGMVAWGWRVLARRRSRASAGDP
jgi:uncharacterized iron-regulated membrane protein